jgi:hypothetical protein
VFQWLKAQGGLAEMEKKDIAKAERKLLTRGSAISMITNGKFKCPFTH